MSKTKAICYLATLKGLPSLPPPSSTAPFIAQPYENLIDDLQLILNLEDFNTSSDRKEDAVDITCPQGPIVGCCHRGA